MANELFKRLMPHSAKLDRLLTQINCRITGIARVRHVEGILERRAEQELKHALEFRAELMRQIASENFVFDAQARSKTKARSDGASLHALCVKSLGPSLS